MKALLAVAVLVILSFGPFASPRVDAGGLAAGAGPTQAGPGEPGRAAATTVVVLAVEGMT